MSPRAKPLSVPIRNFCIAVRWERATAPRSRLYVHCGCHERAALPVQERPRCIESCASEPERLLGMCSTGQVLKVGASFCCACRTWNCTTRRFATYWRRKTASCRCELRLLTRAQLPSTRTGWEAFSKEAMTISLRGNPNPNPSLSSKRDFTVFFFPDTNENNLVASAPVLRKFRRCYTTESLKSGNVGTRGRNFPNRLL
jgi:hypothetical protein